MPRRVHPESLDPDRQLQEEIDERCRKGGRCFDRCRHSCDPKLYWVPATTDSFPNPTSPTMDSASDPSGSITVQARLTLFGHDATETSIELIPRSLQWRLVRTGIVTAIFLVILPIAALIPPHAPWAAGVVLGLVLVGRGRWLERYTIVGLKGVCPRCGTSLQISKRMRLRQPHPISCEGCNHDVMLTTTVA